MSAARALKMVGAGLPLFDGTFLERLAAVDPRLTQPVHPDSLLFRTWFEVFVVNFVVGFALAVQPHFIIKALYVKTERDVNTYLAVAIGCGVLFNLVLLCGLYARVEAGEFIAQYTAANRMGIDGVVPAWILHAFPPAIGVVISMALLAAGMSTLDGMLVAVSAIFANDVYLVLKRDAPLTPAERLQAAFRVGRYSLVGFGVLAFVLSLVQHRSKELSVALFAQEGVYALFAATFVPVLFGMFGRVLPARVVVTASSVALAVHFAFRYLGLTVLTTADYTNPGLTATYGLLVSLAVVGSWYLARGVATRLVASGADGS